MHTKTPAVYSHTNYKAIKIIQSKRMQGNIQGYFRHYAENKYPEEGIFAPKKGNSKPWYGTLLSKAQAQQNFEQACRRCRCVTFFSTVKIIMTPCVYCIEQDLMCWWPTRSPQWRPRRRRIATECFQCKSYSFLQSVSLLAKAMETKHHAIQFSGDTFFFCFPWKSVS